MAKKCVYENCEKYVVWGFIGAKALYCKIHKLDGMVDLVHKKCEIENCNKNAICGLPGEKKKYCIKHKMLEMDKPGECLYENCTTQANFGIPGEKAQYCKKHILDGMIDVNSKKCEIENCNNRAIFGPVGGSRSFCLAHKNDMVNLVYKRCRFIGGCTDMARYGPIGGEALYCFKHKLSDMTNLVSKRCSFETCDIIGPKFGYPGGKPEYCSRHKLVDMVDLVHCKCDFEDCDKIPKFGLIKGKPTHCVVHKSTKMINVSHKRCTSCSLFQVEKKNNYLCSYCSPTQRQTKKEDIVKKLLEQQNYEFVHNKQIGNGSCVKYRPDFLFDCGNYFVVLECDEEAHKHYDPDCELSRMNNIFYGLGLPTLFIRYNPDLKSVSRKVKHEKLLETLEYCLYKENIPQVEPIYLFYETNLTFS